MGDGEGESEGGFAGFILKGLVNGVLSKIGGEAFGWVLSSILGGDSLSGGDLSRIEAQLQLLQQEMEQVLKDLKNIELELKNIELEQLFEPRAKQVSDIQSDVQAKLKTMAVLQPKDKPLAEGIQSWALANCSTYLLQIHNAMVTGGWSSDPGTPGLICLYGDKCLQAATSDPAYARGAVMAGSPLDEAYRDLENYFRTLINLQVQTLSLYVNALNSSQESDIVPSAIAGFQQCLAQQCLEFIGAAEALTINYCVDGTLFDLFRTSAFNADPIRRADAFVDDYLYNVSTDANGQLVLGNRLVEHFRLRVWGVTCPGSFGTPNFNSLLPPNEPLQPGQESGAGTGLALQQGGGAPLLPTESTHIVFPACEGGVIWSLYRHSFADPADGTWTLVPPSGARGQFNTLLDPFSNDVVRLGSTIALPSPLTYTFDVDTRPTRYHVAFTSRTALMLDGQNHVRIDQQFNFTTTSVTLEAWFRAPQPGQLSPGTIVGVPLKDGADSTAAIFALGIPEGLVGLQAYVQLSGPVTNYYNIVTPQSFPASIADGNWHHVAAVLDNDRSSGAIALYLDGQPLAVNVSARFQIYNQLYPAPVGQEGSSLDWDSGVILMGGPNLSAPELVQGRFDQPGGLAGQLSEVRIWNVARQASDIQQAMHRRLQGSEPGLAFLWNLDLGGVAGGTFTGGGSSQLIPMQGDWLSAPSWETTGEAEHDGALTVLNGTLLLAFRDRRNALCVSTSPDGSTWSTTRTIYPYLLLQGTPALAAPGPYSLAFRSNDGTNTLVVGTSPDGVTWSLTPMPHSTFRGSPSLMVPSGNLFVAFRAVDDTNVLWQYVDNAQFSSVMLLQGSPSLAFSGESPYVAFRANDPSHALYVGVGSSAGWQFASAALPVKAADGTLVQVQGSPALTATSDGTLWAAFNWGGQLQIASLDPAAVSEPGPFLVARSFTTVTFPDKTVASLQGSPALVANGSTLYAAYTPAGSAGTFFIISSPDGVNWSLPVSVSKHGTTAPPQQQAKARLA